MDFTITVNITVSHVGGPYMTRQQILNEILENLDMANPNGIEDGEAAYNIDTWDVVEGDVAVG